MGKDQSHTNALPLGLVGEKVPFQTCQLKFPQIRFHQEFGALFHPI